MKSLTIEGLTSAHGQLVAFRNLSFRIEAGQVVSLIGANGAGKTTLLRTIAGGHRHAAGSVHLGDTDVSHLPAFRRVASGLSLVPEGRRLFADMTVEENLRLGEAAGRSGPWTVEAVFDAFPNLTNRRHNKAGGLSGGEAQATAIGRALMSNPDVLLLDEVSLGLSPLAVNLVYQSLSRLVASGVTVVLVEQDLSKAMSVADRVLCMCEGRIVLDRPRDKITKEEIKDAYFGLRSGAGEKVLQ